MRKLILVVCIIILIVGCTSVKDSSKMDSPKTKEFESNDTSSETQENETGKNEEKEVTSEDEQKESTGKMNLHGETNVLKPSEVGALQLREINGVMTLCDESGNPVQLKGMSVAGLQWFPGIINNNAYKALATDWQANAIRLALYVGEGGYAQKPELKDVLIQGIEYGIANDLYVIVDWHVHKPGNPNDPIYAGAYAFFEEIVDLYPNNPNLIYELVNEPNPSQPGVTNDMEGWKTVKAYAEPIISMIREKGNDNIIIVGTPNWSQRPDLAADNPIEGVNIMYSVHFYTGTHKVGNGIDDRGNVMCNARYALENGVGIFVSEWGTTEADGDKGPYLKAADSWLHFLNLNNVSWINWSLSNKAELSAAIMPYELGVREDLLDPGDTGWAIEDLTVSGEYARAMIKGIDYEPIERVSVKDISNNAPLGKPTFPSDFEDLTRNGWTFDGASGQKTEILVTEVLGSNMLGFDITYPDKKPTDGWASAARLVQRSINAKRGENRYFTADLYLSPARASEGKIIITLAFSPPQLEYWAQVKTNVEIDMSSFKDMETFADNLYHFKVVFDMDDIMDGKIIGGSTNLRDITFVIADGESDFIGHVYLDNFQFENVEE